MAVAAMQELSLEDAFDSYCIVCDRLIVPPKEKEDVAVKPKKKAAGAIRVKNPDGSTTTRTANGTKTTRPALKRNQGSSTRLATVAANNHAASKLAPLSRTKTTSPTGDEDKDKATSPTSTPTACPPAFLSSIYCSQACAQLEQGRSEASRKDMSRTFSSADVRQHRPSMDGIITNMDVHSNPYAPPSPLFMSSDTESSNSVGAAAPLSDSGPASSAPKMMEYFRMSRGGPDDAWNDVQRQRRSSMNPSFRPPEMTRQNTTTSYTTTHSGVSSDSLSSMWDPDLYLGRSTSNQGKMRMTPMSHPVVSSDEERAVGPTNIPSRPSLPRSNLSHTSLGTSSSPSDMSLLKQYAESFHGRNALSTSYTVTHRGSLAAPSPASAALDARRASMHAGVRPSGTIRAKSSITWDSLGKQAVREREQVQAGRLRRAESHVTTSALAVPSPQPEHGSPQHHHDLTPRQSLKVENGQWRMVQVAAQDGLGKNGTIRCKSRTSSKSTQSSHSSGGSDNHPITSAAFLAPPSTGSISPSSTTTMTMTIPGVTAAASTTPTPSASGPNWGAYEAKGGKTYALPAGLNVPNQKGLFYFH